MSRGAVQTDARRPVQISNGGTGVLVNNGKADRAQVRAGARAITREGVSAYGEM